MAVGALLGTLDTKGLAYGFHKKITERTGDDPLDVDVLWEPAKNADVTREEIAEKVGDSLGEARKQLDRGHAISYMSKGVTKGLGDLAVDGCIQGSLDQAEPAEQS